MSVPYAQAAVLCLLTTFAYYDGLLDVARADQLIYLHRTIGMPDLWSLTIGAFDFNRAHPPGDFLLFRPVLYFILGLERWAFGYNFTAWQATSLALHVAVVLTVFQYTREVLHRNGTNPDRSCLPFLWALSFAVLCAGVELVVWQHVVGYLAFCWFLVCMLLVQQRLFDRPTRGAVVILIAMATLCSFTYEIGVVATGMLAIVNLAHAKRSQRCGLFLATASAHFLVCIAYVAVSWLDYASYRSPTGDPFSLDWWRLTYDTIAVAYRWLLAMVFPFVLRLHPGARIWGGVSGKPVYYFAMLVVVGLSLRATVLMKPRRRDVGSGLFLLVLAVAYALVIVVGRAMPRGLIETLSVNTYYAYIFALLVWLAAFHFVGAQVARSPGDHGWAPQVAFAGLLLVICLNIIDVRSLLRQQRYDYAQPIAQLVGRVQRLIGQHQSESDFSFTVEPGCAGNLDVPWFAGETPVKRKDYPVAWILFPQYERDSGGKYLVGCSR